MIGRLVGWSTILVLAACSSSGTPQATSGAGGGTGAAGLSGSGATGGSSSGGAGGSAGGAAGSAGTATGGAGTGGTPGTGGTAGTTVVGAPCDARPQFTLATHDVLNVTWPAGAATLGGTGQVHLWGKIAFTADGNNLTGSIQACGTVLPATDLIPQIGGGKILIEVPPAVWDGTTVPRFQINATQTGWNVGSTVSFTYAALVGFTESDPANAPWPASSADITMTNDFDGDTHPGVTGLPRNGGGYLLPPTSALGALSTSPRADKLYLVDRNVASVTLTRTSCDAASGVSTFMHFDNHLVGCHVNGGTECTPTEVKFIDDNRTIYTVTSATTTGQIVNDTAACADVRQALPM